MSSNRREPCLEPASVVAVFIYSLLLAGGLIAHVILALRDDGGARSAADGTPNGGSTQR